MVSECDLLVKYIEKCFVCPPNVFEELVCRVYESRRRGFRRVHLVPKHIASIDLGDVEVVAEGALVGWVKGRNFVPSTQLFELLKELGCENRCWVVAEEHGVKAVLYGNDLLVTSTKEISPYAKKGWYVAIVDPSDGRVVAVGRLCIDSEELKRAREEGRMLEVVVKNVFDLGMAIRREEVFD